MEAHATEEMQTFRVQAGLQKQMQKYKAIDVVIGTSRYAEGSRCGDKHKAIDVGRSTRKRYVVRSTRKRDEVQASAFILILLNDASRQSIIDNMLPITK
jgi:hypothetical protein